MQPHYYLLVKSSADRLWGMGNADTKGAYTDDSSSHLTLTRSSEPGETTTSPNVTVTWADGEAKMIMNHNDSFGTILLVP